VRQAVIDNGSRDESDRGIGVTIGSVRNGLASTFITTKKPRKGGNCLVADFNARIGGQNGDKVCYNACNAKVLCAAPLAGETMQCNLAHRCHRIAESKPKYLPRGIAGIVVQKKQAGSPNSQIRVAKCGYLDGGDGYLAAETCSPLLRQRAPSTDEIVCDFNIRPCHGSANNPDRLGGQYSAQAVRARQRPWTCTGNANR
jgi:hypothetical protein